MTLATTYKALSDNSRLRILYILSHGFFNVQEITGILGGSQPTISHHLKVLSRAGLIASHKEGTWIYYASAQDENHSYAPLVIKNLVSLIQSGLLNGDSEQFRRDGQAVNTLLLKRRDQSRSFFDSVAPQWKKLRETPGFAIPGDVPYLDIIADKIPSNGTLLELGCGSGLLLEKLLPRRGITIGVDYSPAMLQEARNSLGERAVLVDLRLGYLEHLPVSESSVDCAVACMVFHHLATPQEALVDICRVLKPGATVHIVDLIRHNEEYMRERFADLWLGFEPQEFRNWLEKSGFAHCTVELVGPKKDVFILTATKRKKK